jgi:flagellar protein FliS
MSLAQVQMRGRYLAETVATASPARLLVMLYDRLLLDLHRALAAVRASDRAASGELLAHAQDIVTELRSSLDLTVWGGARGLADIYSFVGRELIAANLRQDAGRIEGCVVLLEPLRDAWREAAQQCVATGDAGPSGISGAAGSGIG